MGRPLNKKFFGDGANKIACLAWFVGEGSAELAYITSQRSNRKYAVASEAGPGTRTGTMSLVEGAPTAAGEMQVTVTPEFAQAGSEATFTIDTDGAGAVSAVAITDGGYGYFVSGTFTITDLTLAGGDDAVIAYTTTDGVITGAAVSVPGTGYTISQTGVAVNTADVPDASGAASEESAKIINARTVKTFEGNTYVWPSEGGVGTGDKGRPEADLQSQ